MQDGLICAGCGNSCAIYKAVAGTISDGSGSSEYSANANCKWVIAPSLASFVSITFSEFDTQSTDWVRVYKCVDATCSSPELQAQLSGAYSSPQSVTVLTGYMLVWFSSDGYVQRPGFTASWTSSSPAPPVRALLAPHLQTFCDMPNLWANFPTTSG
jgi:hypothetical protein